MTTSNRKSYFHHNINFFHVFCIKDLFTFVVIAGLEWTPECEAIFLLGGAAGNMAKSELVAVANTAYNYVEVFDINMERIFTTNLPEHMPAGRFYMSAVVVKDAGKTDIYVLGGGSHMTEVDEEGVSGWSYSERSVWKYSLCDNKWRVMSEMTVARAYTVAVYIDGYIYLAGGWNHTDRTLSSVERYHISDNTWHTTRDLPYELVYAAGCSMSGVAYISGGRKPRGVISSDVLCYDADRDEWKVTVSLVTARHLHMMCCSGQHLYVVGGGGGKYLLDSVERWSPGEATFTLMTNSTMPWKRQCTSAVYHDNKIYVLGGYGTSCRSPDKARATDSVLVLDVTTGRWRELDSPLSALSRPVKSCCCVLVTPP